MTVKVEYDLKNKRKILWKKKLTRKYVESSKTEPRC